MLQLVDGGGWTFGTLISAGKLGFKPLRKSHTYALKYGSWVTTARETWLQLVYN